MGFGVGDANANCSARFSETYCSKVAKTRHFKRVFFLQRGLSPPLTPLPLDPIPCPNQALWIRLCVPRIGARFTSKRARSVLREKPLNKFKGSGGAGHYSLDT